MKRNITFLIFSLALSTTIAQIGEQAYNFALQQFSKGNYAQAAKEFNRSIFLGTANKAASYHYVAKCYSQINEYELSNSFYDKAYFAEKNDSIKSEILLNKSFSNILRKQFKTAYYELINIDSLYSSTQTKKFWLYTGVAFYGMDDAQNAQICFAKNLDSLELIELESSFAYLSKMQKRHRPSRVETMSYILPGLGQIHTGNIKSGVNSAVLLSAIFYGMIQVGRIYSPFDGLFLFAPWFQRYYMGGAEKAKHMAEHKLIEKKNEVFNRILEIGAIDE